MHRLLKGSSRPLSAPPGGQHSRMLIVRHPRRCVRSEHSLPLHHPLRTQSNTLTPDPGTVTHLRDTGPSKSTGAAYRLRQTHLCDTGARRPPPVTSLELSAHPHPPERSERRFFPTPQDCTRDQQRLLRQRLRRVVSG